MAPTRSKKEQRDNKRKQNRTLAWNRDSGRNTSRGIEKLVHKKINRYNDIVSIYCGRKTTARFQLVRGELMEASPFFRSALSAGWFETSKNRISMPDDEPHIFSLFIDWLRKREDMFADEDGGLVPIADLVDLYIFADKLDLPDLQDRIITHMWRHRKQIEGDTISVEICARAVEMLNTDSGMVWFLVDWWLWKGKLNLEIEQMMTRARPFADRALTIVQHNYHKFMGIPRGLDGFERWTEDRGVCYFHVHGTDDDCPDKGLGA